MRYASELLLSEDVVTDTVEQLRVHALEKLAARQKLQNTGRATLKIKLAGHVPPQVGATVFVSLQTKICIYLCKEGVIGCPLSEISSNKTQKKKREKKCLSFEDRA